MPTAARHTDRRDYAGTVTDPGPCHDPKALELLREAVELVGLEPAQVLVDGALLTYDVGHARPILSVRVMLTAEQADEVLSR